MQGHSIPAVDATFRPLLADDDLLSSLNQLKAPPVIARVPSLADGRIDVARLAVSHPHLCPQPTPKAVSTDSHPPTQPSPPRPPPRPARFDLPSSIKLSLESYILSGRVFSAFKAHTLVRGPCGRTHPTTVAVKLNQLSKSNMNAVKEIACEAWIYTLLSHRDLVAPFHGVYATSGAEALVASVLDHAGEAMTDAAAQSLSEEDKSVLCGA